VRTTGTEAVPGAGTGSFQEPEPEQDKNQEQKVTPAGGLPPGPAFPPAKSVSQSGFSYSSIPSLLASAAGTVSREKWIEYFSAIDVVAFKANPGKAVSCRWSLMAKLIGSPKIHPIWWDDNPAYGLGFNNLILVDAYNLIKLQASLWWIPKDSKLHGVDSTKENGGFFADFHKMLAISHNSIIHEWTYKWLHNIEPQKPEHLGCIGTVYWEGKAYLIGLEKELDVPFLVDPNTGVKTVLKDWKWNYDTKRQVSKTKAVAQ